MVVILFFLYFNVAAAVVLLLLPGWPCCMAGSAVRVGLRLYGHPRKALNNKTKGEPRGPIKSVNIRSTFTDGSQNTGSIDRGDSNESIKPGLYRVIFNKNTHRGIKCRKFFLPSSPFWLLKEGRAKNLIKMAPKAPARLRARTQSLLLFWRILVVRVKKKHAHQLHSWLS